MEVKLAVVLLLAAVATVKVSGNKRQLQQHLHSKFNQEELMQLKKDIINKAALEMGLDPDNLMTAAPNAIEKFMTSVRAVVVKLTSDPELKHALLSAVFEDLGQGHNEVDISRHRNPFSSPYPH